MEKWTADASGCTWFGIDTRQKGSAWKRSILMEEWHGWVWMRSDERAMCNDMLRQISRTTVYLVLRHFHRFSLFFIDFRCSSQKCDGSNCSYSSCVVLCLRSTGETTWIHFFFKFEFISYVFSLYLYSKALNSIIMYVFYVRSEPQFSRKHEKCQPQINIIVEYN